MKISRRDPQFTRAELESFLLWKVFWKMIRVQSPIVFTLKIFGCGVFLAALIFLLCLTGEIARGLRA